MMAEWLEQASQWHKMYYHDLEDMSSNPGQVELRVSSTFVLSRTWTKHINAIDYYLQVHFSFSRVPETHERLKMGFGIPIKQSESIH